MLKICLYIIRKRNDIIKKKMVSSWVRRMNDSDALVLHAGKQRPSRQAKLDISGDKDVEAVYMQELQEFR